MTDKVYITLSNKDDVENGPNELNVQSTTEKTKNFSLTKFLQATSIVGGLLVFFALGTFVALLYVRTLNLEEHYQKIKQNELSAVVQGKTVSKRLIKRSLDLSEIGYNTPEESNLDEQSGETETDNDDRNKLDKDLDQSDKTGLASLGKSAIRLTGTTLHQTLIKEAGFHIIDNWSVNKLDDANFQLKDNSVIEVQQSGTYLIYAQLSWRKRQGMARFSIDKSEEEESLATCVTSFSDKFAQLDSCYTSIAVELKAGDRVYVTIANENLTLDFMKGRAFFGVILLDEFSADGEDSSPP